MDAKEVRRIYNQVVAKPEMPTVIARDMYTWRLMRMIVRGLFLVDDLSPEQLNDIRQFDQ